MRIPKRVMECSGCGEPIVVIGSRKKQDGKCSACSRAEATAVAVVENREAGMSGLTGTPKQVAWAEQIRWRFRKILEMSSLLSCHPWASPVIDKYLSCTSAHEWIERRGDTPCEAWLQRAVAQMAATDEVFRKRYEVSMVAASLIMANGGKQ